MYEYFHSVFLARVISKELMTDAKLEKEARREWWSERSLKYCACKFPWFTSWPWLMPSFNYSLQLVPGIMHASAFLYDLNCCTIIYTWIIPFSIYSLRLLVIKSINAMEFFKEIILEYIIFIPGPKSVSLDNIVSDFVLLFSVSQFI